MTEKSSLRPIREFQIRLLGTLLLFENDEITGRGEKLYIKRSPSKPVSEWRSETFRNSLLKIGGHFIGHTVC